MSVFIATCSEPCRTGIFSAKPSEESHVARTHRTEARKASEARLPKKEAVGVAVRGGGYGYGQGGRG